jgi:hypothetical protein
MSKFRLNKIRSIIYQFLDKKYFLSSYDKSLDKKVVYLDFEKYILFGRRLLKVKLNLIDILLSWYYNKASIENLEILFYILHGYLNKELIIEEKFIKTICKRISEFEKNSNGHYAALYVLFLLLDNEKQSEKISSEIILTLKQEHSFIANNKNYKNTELRSLYNKIDLA